MTEPDRTLEYRDPALDRKCSDATSWRILAGMLSGATVTFAVAMAVFANVIDDLQTSTSTRRHLQRWFGGSLATVAVVAAVFAAIHWVRRARRPWSFGLSAGIAVAAGFMLPLAVRG